MNPILLTDYYKTEHFRMYPKNTSAVYSNLTARKSRIEGVNQVVFFGLQYFIKEYLIEMFNKHFFDRPIDEVLEEYSFAIKTTTKHIEDLHELGYLPIEIKAVPEGTKVPIGVPMLTIKNTNKKFYWLTNYLETLMSAILWQPITSATIANQYYTMLSKFAIETTGSDEFVTWQGHDFSMRGMQGIQSAILSGMGHLLSFTGTDTIPAIYALKKYYGGEGLIGASVPATEHSVMCAGSKDGEIETFERLLDLYPSGILSVVSDTWDLWKVCTEYLPKLKEKVLARDGKLVIRPDSGDPVDIICGKGFVPNKTYTHGTKEHAEAEGVVNLLWDVFGGTINSKGYKVLNPCIGAIYGDSITPERAKQICKRLKANGFATTNVVLGIGSYTYTYNTRDTFGMAVKATYIEICHCGENDTNDDGDCGRLDCKHTEGRAIFKDPITDDGTKKSAKGLLRVEWGSTPEGPSLFLFDNQTKEGEGKGQLQTVFRDGFLVREENLAEIRERLKNRVYA